MSSSPDPSRSREREIVTALNDKPVDVNEQLRLIIELQKVGTELSIDALRDGLRSPHRRHCVGAQYALANIGSEKAIAALIESLQTAESVCVSFIARSLVKLRARDAVPALIGCLQDRRELLDGSAKRSVIRALACMPHRSAVPVLAASLRERDRHTRKAAAWALVRTRAPESTVALESAVAELPWIRGRGVRQALRAKRRHGDD
jgi:HEAT repeat protein